MPSPTYGFVDFKRTDYGTVKAKKTLTSNVSPGHSVPVVQSTAEVASNVFLSPASDHLGGLGTVSDLGEGMRLPKNQAHVSQNDIVRSQKELLAMHQEIMALENELRKIRPP